MKKRTGGIRGRRKKICTAAAAVILFLVMLLSAAMLSWKYSSDQQGKTEYQLTRKIAGLEDTKDRKERKEVLPLPLPDEDRLMRINPDYAGWLFIPGTPVSYPVVYPKNNGEYLNQTFDGQKNPCGCLFFEASCVPLSSENTVIYGHNMKSGEMFGSLKKYRKEEFLRKNKVIYLCFGGEWTEYQIQRVYLTDSRDISPYESAGTFLTGQHLTLSTCHGREQRLIIQAERGGKEQEMQKRMESDKPRQKFSLPCVDILF